MTRYFGRIEYGKPRKKYSSPKNAISHGMRNPDKQIYHVERPERGKQLMLLNTQDKKVLLERYPDLEIREASSEECTSLLERELSQLRMSRS